MLHNMDKFFGKLLEQRDYGSLLRIIWRGMWKRW